ncbi:MAG: hypothetical protein K2H57_12065 [Duncaniella sp.]|nr:hypothetical protein [Duncaniella sp.]
MAEFTSGERRGLIVLIAILACLTLVLMLRRGLDHNDAASASETVEIHAGYTADSVGVLRGDSAARAVKVSRKTGTSRKHKSRKSPAPAPAPRSPLDEPLN